MPDQSWWDPETDGISLTQAGCIPYRHKTAQALILQFPEAGADGPGFGKPEQIVCDDLWVRDGDPRAIGGRFVACSQSLEDA
jgi:hypothetical protein